MSEGEMVDAAEDAIRTICSIRDMQINNIIMELMLLNEVDDILKTESDGIFKIYNRGELMAAVELKMRNNWYSFDVTKYYE